MHSGYRFSELGDSMGIGFLADEIVLALAKAERGDQLSPFERDSLKKGAADLDAALEGNKWPDNPTLCESTARFSASYSRAVMALPQAQTPDEFLRQINDLKTIAYALANGQNVKPEEIRTLRSFFFNSSQSELAKTEELLRGKSSSDLLLKWKVSSE